MAVSGSFDFTRTRDQICTRALRIGGIIKEGETPGAQMITDTAEALNSMVKLWQKKPSMRLWAVREATLFPQVSQIKYELGTAGTDHATETFYETAVTSDAASGETSISLDSTTNIAVSDNIGIVVDDGTLHWTTVSSKTSTSVVIATALDDDAAADNPVFTYTTKIVRPLKVVDARRYNISGATDTPISDSQGSLMARLDYQSIPNKTQTGTINRAFYDAERGSLGYLYIWQAPATITDLVKFTFHRPLMDFDAASDDPDFPQEWINPIVWNLAVDIAPEYDVPMERLQVIVQRAAAYLEDVMGDDREGESFYMQPAQG